ncbi:MAG: epoxyqueuosine reductase QueH [Bacteroidales bacterium]|nr:epoxyqueuosine reductase QueH [Bacteroidales bacterium]
MILRTPDSSDRIVLHTCCAPCSSAIIEALMDNGITPVIFYSNSNIFPRQEYLVRKEECSRYALKLGLEIIDDDYCHSDWLEGVKGLECEPERGGRCLECFRFRLLRSARFAASRGISVFTTTLASSRWKSLEQINTAGAWAASQVEGTVFWDQNWRKGGLQERRNALLKENGFYNQLYCGCEFSISSGNAQSAEGNPCRKTALQAQ